MKFTVKACMVLLSLLSLLSCTKEGRTVYVVTEEDEETRDLVYFVTRKGALGDIGYMDDMYRGAVRGAQSCNMMLSLLELPSDTETAVAAIGYLLDYMRDDEPEREALVVLAGDDFEPMLHEYDSLLTSASNVDFLLAESSDTTLPVYTLRIPQYGIWYQAGRLVAEGFDDVGKILSVRANRSNTILDEMYDGFAAAIADSGSDKTVTDIALSDDTGGYDEAALTYKMSYKLGESFQLLLPLCGGSAQGFYRYNREDSDSFYTLGVDCDMQLYSPKVPFSVVKNIGSAVEDWIFRWWNGEEMPFHEELGLSSGYPRIVIADDYRDRLDGIADKYYDKALEEERKYEGK